MGFQWELRTSVIAGSGAIERAAPALAGRGRRVLVVTDPAPACRRIGGLVAAALGRAGVAADVRPLAPPATVAAARRLAVELAADPVGVVAVGGGSVIDVAKVAAAAARNPALLDDRRWVVPDGVVMGDCRRPALPCAAVPTTVGTGTEVSAVAVLDAGGTAGPKLLVDPALRPSDAVLDPRQVEGLAPPALLAGALEITLRAVGPALGSPAPRPLADGLAVSLASVAVRAGDRIAAAAPDRPDADDAVTLALTSAQTHVAWSGVGRNPYAHRLWYLAHAVVQVAGVAKMTATAALLPAYLRWLHAGRLPAHPALAELLGACGLGPDAAGRLRAWGLPTALDELPGRHPPDVLAAQAHESFAAGPLAGIDRATLARFYQDALSH